MDLILAFGLLIFLHTLPVLAFCLRRQIAFTHP